MKLSYDTNKWVKDEYPALNTLQIFITDKCNKRCSGCFYKYRLGTEDMSFYDYKHYVEKYREGTDKVILIGGEPSLHPRVADFIRYNHDSGLKTTVYTNGYNLKAFEDVSNLDVKIRIGIMGLNVSEKPLAQITPVDFPVTVVYMLRMDNIHELYSTAAYSETIFNCKDFYISNIREVDRTGSFWFETPETLPLSPSLQPNFSNVVQDFVNYYRGDMERLHICRRGVIEGGLSVTHCRYINIFPNGDLIICPFDISRNIKAKDYKYRTRLCQKHSECILQKIVLKRK